LCVLIKLTDRVGIDLIGFRVMLFSFLYLIKKHKIQIKKKVTVLTTFNRK
jgi:hypothetical protein